MKSKFKISGVIEIEHPLELPTNTLKEIMKRTIDKRLYFTSSYNFDIFTSKGWCNIELEEEKI